MSAEQLSDMSIATQEEDPLNTPLIPKQNYWESIDRQSGLTTLGYLAMFVVGLSLLLTFTKSAAMSQTIGTLLFDAGLGSIFVALWQIFSSQELAYRRKKLLGFSLSVLMIIVGLILIFGFGNDPPGMDTFIPEILLALSLGPCLTTLLLLEPKEKETMAMPYVNNFVKMVSKGLDGKDPQYCGYSFVILVPTTATACENLHQRAKDYKTHNCYTETGLECGGWKKFSVNLRKGRFFDVPSMLNNASARKLYLFTTTLQEYIAVLQKQGLVGNVHIQMIKHYSLPQVDQALSTVPGPSK